jgi:hypothetical protein
MLGTWAETAEQCAAKDKTNIVIQPAKYRDGGGDCAVRWIVETAGSDGVNYAVHSLCTGASLPEKTQTKNIIVRPLGPSKIRPLALGITAGRSSPTSIMKKNRDGVRRLTKMRHGHRD